MHETMVMLIEAQPALSQGLTAALDETEDIRVVGTAENIASGRVCAAQLHPDVVVVDTANTEGGIFHYEEVCDLAPGVVVLASEKESFSGLGAGQSVVVPRELSINDLITAIRRAAESTPGHPPPGRSPLSDGRPKDNPLTSLTPRELEVLELLICGLSHRAIATRLNIAVNTVRTHTHNIQLKWGVHSNLAIVAHALGRGIPDEHSC